MMDGNKIEVIVATRNQTDFSLFYKMNIQTDVIFCNQCKENSFKETYINGKHVRMISTTTTGVGVNRNIGFLLSDADICLFSDDDVVYEKNYSDIIISNFEKYADADMIAFNALTSRDGKTFTKAIKKTKRTRKTYGAFRLAIRNARIKKYNISFSTLFGGGCLYSCGEDTLFCNDVIKKGKFYQCKDIIEVVNHNPSTWFFGYNKKYFFDKGALLKAMHPFNWRITKYYLILKFIKKTNINFINIIKLMNDGAKSFSSPKSYNDYYAK